MKDFEPEVQHDLLIAYSDSLAVMLRANTGVGTF